MGDLNELKVGPRCLCPSRHHCAPPVPARDALQQGARPTAHTISFSPLSRPSFPVPPSPLLVALTLALALALPPPPPLSLALSSAMSSLPPPLICSPLAASLAAQHVTRRPALQDEVQGLQDATDELLLADDDEMVK